MYTSKKVIKKSFSPVLEQNSLNYVSKKQVSHRNSEYIKSNSSLKFSFALFYFLLKILNK